jgi:putative phosphoribosyl transferase
VSTRFADRAAAGRLLGQRLHALGLQPPLIVLALPRGGVPVGFEIAQALGAELDVLIVRKIGAPGQEELGIGAIVDGDHPVVVINDYVAAMVGADARYIEAVKQRQLAEVERRKLAYRGTAPDPVVSGRTVIVVDDGIATGGTMKAALRALRARAPARLILAVPLAPPDSIAELAGECDEIVCLLQPTPFYAIGGHYADFGQTSDEEVVRLLAAAKQARQKTAPGGAPA